MENVNEVIGMGAAMRRMVEVEGECPTHGIKKVWINPKVTPEWFCNECHHAKVMAEEDAKMRANRRAHLHYIAQLPAKYLGKPFPAKTPAQKQARVLVKAFLDAINPSESTWAVLVLFGGVGTGKTRMATELAESIIDKMGRSVRYCTAKQMISEIRAAYSTEGKTEAGEIERFVQYSVLIIDEIDVKSDSENANQLMGEVINRRYNADKPVVVITNQAFDKLGAFVGDRVLDRLHENAMVAHFTWGSFRSARGENETA